MTRVFIWNELEDFQAIQAFKPSFLIFKDNKILDMAGVGDKSPFGRSINPNLNQFSFFNSIGYLKMIKKCEIIPVLKQSVEHLFKKFYLSIC